MFICYVLASLHRIREANNPVVSRQLARFGLESCVEWRLGQHKQTNGDREVENIKRETNREGEGHREEEREKENEKDQQTNNYNIKIYVPSKNEQISGNK